MLKFLHNVWNAICAITITMIIAVLVVVIVIGAMIAVILGMASTPGCGGIFFIVLLVFFGVFSAILGD